MLEDLAFSGEVAPKLISTYAREWLQFPTRFADLLEEVKERFDKCFKDLHQTVKQSDGSTCDIFVGLARKKGVTKADVDIFRQQLRGLNMIYSGVLPLLRLECELFASIPLNDIDFIRDLWIGVDHAHRSNFSEVSMVELQCKEIRFWSTAQMVCSNAYFQNQPPPQTSTAIDPIADVLTDNHPDAKDYKCRDEWCVATFAETRFGITKSQLNRAANDGVFGVTIEKPKKVRVEKGARPVQVFRHADLLKLADARPDPER